jgi:protein-tyrosine phosphatase
MKILMVCLGNICRSPIAEVILNHLAREKGLDWTIRSAGTNRYHKGGPADARTVAICRERGHDLTAHIARRVTTRDFEEYDVLFSMAEDVTDDLRAMCPRPELMGKVRPFRPGGEDVPDPWHGGAEGFAEGFDIVEAAALAQMIRLSSNK